MQKCRVCGLEKPIIEFGRNKGYFSGIDTLCKLCRKPIAKISADKVKKEYRMFLTAKQRAKLLGLEFNIELKDIIIPKICPLLNIPINIDNGRLVAKNDSPSLDRIDNTKGYIKGNIRVISYRANAMKNNITLDFAYRLVAYIKREI